MVKKLYRKYMMLHECDRIHIELLAFTALMICAIGVGTYYGIPVKP